MRNHSSYLVCRTAIIISTVIAAVFIFGSRACAWQMKQAPLMTDWAAQVDSANPLPEYPRPQMVRSDWLNLNGVWQFKRGYAADVVPVGQNLGGDILVPFPVESAISGVMARYDRVWYRRTFTVPPAWAGKRIILNFGAVDWEAQIYINGTSVGIHQGGYDPFSYDITPYLTGSGTQEIIVRVYDPTNNGGQPRGKQTNAPGGIYYTGSTGIWQTVWLEPVSTTSISNIKIVPDVDNSRLKLTVNVSGAASGMTVTATAKDGSTAVGTVTGDPNSELYIAIPNPKLWSPDSPFLYDLDVSLKSGGNAVDSVSSYFGMRKIAMGTVDGIKKMLLNGQFVFQMGPLDQGYWPDGIYTAPTDAALKFDLEMEKQLGYNTVRKHGKVEPQRWYYWADKLGLLVWQDMPSANNTTTADQNQFEYEFQKMIETHWNSPSIIMWIIWNEGWGMYHETDIPPASTRVTNWAKSFDPSRIISLCSGYYAKAGEVMDAHGYPNPYFPDNPDNMVRVCGEYGGIGYPIAGHMWTKYTFSYTDVTTAGDLTDLYGQYTSTEVGAFKTNKGLSGAIYTQITDVEGEINGLLTYDRKILKPLVQGIIDANHFCYVPATVTVTATAGTGGTISPSGAVAVHMATNKTFTIAANQVGYAISDVVVDGVSQGPIATYTFPDVRTPHTISAIFGPVPTCTIIATAGTGGTISESGAVLVNQGGNKTFTFAPNSGYTIFDVTVDGVSKGAITTYTFSNVVVDHVISVSFEAMPPQTITARAGANGSISPSGAVQVAYNTNQTFTFPGYLGYKVGNVIVDGVAQGAITSYTFINVTADHSISATFVPQSPVAFYQFENNVDDTQNSFNGTAYNTPSYVTGKVGSKAIQFNGTTQYVTIPRPVSTDWTISFFVKTTQTSPSGTQWYSGKGLVDGEVGGPADDFGISYLNNKVAFGVGNGDKTIQSVSNINGGNWVHVACTRNSTNGQVNVYVNGVLETTGTGPTGAKTRPATLHIGNLQTNGNYFSGAIDHVKIFDTVLVPSDIANLAKEGTNYTITASAGVNGNISPSGTVSVGFGANQTFSIAPATGYAVSDVLVDGNSVGPVGSYTFNYVTTSHTISASFAKAASDIAALKALGTGTLAKLDSSETVIYAPKNANGARTTNFFYIGEEKGLGGLRVVDKGSDTLTIGNQVSNLTGYVRRSNGGEMYLELTVDPIGHGNTPISPIGMNNRTIFSDTQALTNIVRVWGKVTSVNNTTSFTMNDGYGSDVTVNVNGVELPAGLDNTKTVVVTGILSVDKSIQAQSISAF